MQGLSTVGVGLLIEHTGAATVESLPFDQQRFAGVVQAQGLRFRFAKDFADSPCTQLNGIQQAGDGPVMLAGQLRVDGSKDGPNPRLKFLDMIGQAFGGEDIGEELGGALAITALAFGGFQKCAHDESFGLAAGGDHAAIRIPEHLIHAMRKKNQLIGVGIVIDAVIVLFECVSVPVPGEHLEDGEVEKPVDVQDALESLQTPFRIGFEGGFREGL